MSIIVRGKDMPKHCSECDFCVNGFTDKAPIYECVASGCKTVSVLVDHDGKPFNFRPDWCPFIEILPHGRLGDLDALWDKMSNYSDNEGAKMPFGDDDTTIHRDSACFIIEQAPTIIEAEGE